MVGERYSYSALNGEGYDYPTGGSGIAISMKALKVLLEEDPHLVRCHRNDAPDDMTLGVWIRQKSIPLIHSPLMHQVRQSTCI